jgi:hypothetical protein
VSLAELGAVAGIAGSIAVILSLIYLALQIRQAARNQRGTMHQMRAALSTDVMLRIAESDLSRSFRAGLTGDPDITEAEFWRFFYASSAILRTTENAFVQYQDGLVNETHFASAKASARTFLASPGYRALWEATRLSREPGFRAFMDQLEADVPANATADVFATWKTIVARERQDQTRIS